MEDNKLETTGLTPNSQPSAPNSPEGWGRKQRFWTAINSVFMVAIAAFILIIVNYWSKRHYFRIDTTFNQEYALSQKTKNILGSLNNPVIIYALFSQPMDEGIFQVQGKLKDLLEEYKSFGKGKFIYELLQPAQSPEEYEMLKKKFKVETLAPNDMIIICGDRQKNVNLTETFERDQGGYGQPGKVKSFKGEEAITAAILNIIQGKKLTVYFATGHKEPDINDTSTAEGYGLLNAYIKRENIEPRPINLLDKPEVPADCDALVIAGTKKPWATTEIQAVNSYLKNGGRVICLIDPLLETGLEGLLQEWGVKLDDGVILDTEHCVVDMFGGQYITHLIANTFGAHPITNKMSSDDRAIFVVARSIELAPGSSGTELVRSGPNSWLEKDLEGLTSKKQPKFDADKDRKGPLGLAVVVTKDVAGPPATDGTAKKESRLVVIGDSDHLNNKYAQSFNKLDVFMNSLRWMMGQEVLISIEPKKAENTTMELTPGKLTFLKWFSMAILPALGAALGIFMWIMRRD